MWSYRVHTNTNPNITGVLKYKLENDLRKVVLYRRLLGFHCNQLKMRCRALTKNTNFPEEWEQRLMELSPRR